MFHGSELEYLKANPLAEHNSGIALSSNQVPTGGTGNMYDGQAGRAFVQGGGNGGSYYGFGGVENGEKYANGTYAPVLVGSNADANALSPALRISGGGRKRRNTKKGSKKQSRRYKRGYKKYKGTARRSRSHNSRGRFRGRHYMKTLRKKVLNQHGGDGSGMVVGWGAPNGSSLSEANAAYSVGGTVSPQMTALANPAQPTAYNSCHPVK